MSPCTVLVERELATTLPAFWRLGRSSGIRSSKEVSIRLKPVVWELAMLPETFSSAYDCARKPVTAVVSAPNRPMISLRNVGDGQVNSGTQGGRHVGCTFAIDMPNFLLVKSVT